MADTIILVDDEIDLLESLALTLEMELSAFTIKSTTDPNEAKQWIEAERPALLITDVWMPGLSGLDLISFASSRWGRIPIILMTAFASEEVENLLRQGAFKYLPKPFRNQQLLLLVRDAVTRRVNFGGVTTLPMIPEVIQLHLLARSVGVLAVQSTEDKGNIWFDNKQIVHATTKKLSGEEAFLEIFSWRRSQFSFTPQEPQERTIFASATKLMVDAHWRQDQERGSPLQTTEARSNSPPWYSVGDSDVSIEAVTKEQIESVEPTETIKTNDSPLLEEGEATTNDQEKKESEPIMANNIKESLARLVSVDGFLGACLADSESGMCLGVEGGNAGINLEIAAASNAEVVKAKRKAVKNLNLNDSIEDILITLGKQYHLIRPSKNKPTIFFYVVLDRSRSNLALARMTLNEIEKDLIV